MHYCIGVILPLRYDQPRLHDAIDTILAPWDEKDGLNPDGKWDWWVLGGRWTGMWSGYDPATDPAYGDDARLPPGLRVKFEHPDDIVPVTAVCDQPELRMPYAIVAAPDTWLESETFDGSTWIETPDWDNHAREYLSKYRDCWIAIVDIHS